ncbi:uncharacterized protein ANIA_11430 [Aspergillus nidulans FGSC A4]|uniref:Uncharacterized protein n=1 Tax=Emericella nidulans (strain FGSC A4 / ATCC 38163 / CBS 112.46 / NRRL 194 / M139) TaxID=227321 RepID=C8V4Z9_EMENI|nr:hypothetical protein [Aspergillus nidulans FGSC A4]CBF74636.1 TPA: hypothetical protein ANIA_11430 [Aspergillus nidulans FGSC A4]
MSSLNSCEACTHRGLFCSGGPQAAIRVFEVALSAPPKTTAIVLSSLSRHDFISMQYLRENEVIRAPQVAH